jgi:hypothetical protein
LNLKLSIESKERTDEDDIHARNTVIVREAQTPLDLGPGCIIETSKQATGNNGHRRSHGYSIGLLVAALVMRYLLFYTESCKLSMECRMNRAILD